MFQSIINKEKKNKKKENVENKILKPTRVEDHSNILLKDNFMQIGPDGIGVNHFFTFSVTFYF